MKEIILIGIILNLLQTVCVHWMVSPLGSFELVFASPEKKHASKTPNSFFDLDNHTKFVWINCSTGLTVAA